MLLKKTPGKIYIAGPMSGKPDFNFPAFNDAQKMLEDCGWIVFNPARKDEESQIDPVAMLTGDHLLAVKSGFNFREALTWDLARVVEADAIYMLHGWEQSPGARAEHAVAIAMQRHYPEYQILYAY